MPNYPMKTWAAGDPALATDVNNNFTLSNIFGGTGSDGALTITSGTTTISLGNAIYTEKNYTGISITGTGALAFSNPNAKGSIVCLKSSGDVILTSSAAPMIDASNVGAPGGPGTATSGSNGDGTDGTVGWGRPFITNQGLHGHGGAPGTGGNGGAITSSAALFRTYPSYFKFYELFVGAGGGGGGTNSGTGTATSGAGGAGGGCLIIEVRGAWNFTTASGIKVGGSNGVNGDVTGATTAGAGGGGGGGGGMLLVLYNTLTANSGTVTVTGGTGGRSAIVGAGAHADGGGGGGSFVNAGTNGNDTTSNNVANGGNGGDGFSLIQQNTTYS